LTDSNAAAYAHRLGLTEPMDDSTRHAQFPITREWAYLDHATFGPLPASVVEAMDRVAHALSEDVLGRGVSTGSLFDSVRQKSARLLSCPAEQIALLRNTGEGVNLVASGLDWQPGDEVISYEREFPGVLEPWRRLDYRGVVLRQVAARSDFAISCSDIERLVTPRTRVVALSLVQWGSGFRAPMEEIAELCRRRGLWLVVDAAQAAGSLPIDASALGADVIAAHTYKFLLSGFGLAVCVCSPRAIAELRGPHLGWRSVAGAAGLEPSIPSLSNLAALDAALDVLLQIGSAEIESRIADLTEMIATGMQTRGWRVISPRGQGQTSALVSAVHPHLDLEVVRQHLLDHQVVCAVRQDALRISPHVYNTPDDVEQLLAHLPRS
jgi:cysteine desulfurase/selenocysteine lyase